MTDGCVGYEHAWLVEDFTKSDPARSRRSARWKSMQVIIEHSLYFLISLMKNICWSSSSVLYRCTGYRPILDAFQTFSCEKANVRYGCKTPCQIISRDIEDIRCAPSIARGTIVKSSKQGIDWEKVYCLEELLLLLKNHKNTDKLRLVVGNTSTGVYPTKDCNLIIDISRVRELLKCVVHDNGIIIGGAVSITDFMNFIWENKDLSSTYFPIFRHLKRVRVKS